MFEHADDPGRVVIDLTRSHVRDASPVAALDAIETKDAQRGTTVEFAGMNGDTSAFHARPTGGLGNGH